jgi:alkanesulfonate monooxygenase SsuD/methylene tetrahydromethanopterin reductase-like flavin-dependent oxidoreductase (luciferase family)
MKFGVFLNSQHAASDDPRRRFDEMAEQVRLVRQLGFDSVWGGEHHITDGYHYFPLLPLMQRLAAEAEGLELGTNIVLLPLHNPMEIAEIGAFLDVITGGKFNLGVGLGYRPEEFNMFRVPIKQRVGRMVEGVEIIRRLWREDNVTHHGKYWQFDNMTIRPRPLQQPAPPVLIAAQVDAAVERAATIGDGWCMVSTPRTDGMVKHIDLYKEKRREAELPEAEHMVRLYEVCCAEDEETALRRAAPYLIEKYAAYAAWGLPGLTFNPEDSPEEQLRKLAVDRFGVGTPDQVVEALLNQYRIGVNHVTMRTSWPGMPQEDILASLEMIGTKVLPEVRRRIAAGEV